MKSICLMSGGKDSFLAAVIASEQGLELEWSLTVLPQEDSMMFHVPNIRLAEKVASILDLRTEFVPEDDFADALEKAKSRGIECVVSGAIASEFQKTRIERLCTEYGLVSFTPLWMKDQDMVMAEIVNSDVRAIIVSVSAEGLTQDFLGRMIDSALISDLRSVSERRAINISGEGGEYETFVVGYSGRKSLRIVDKEIIWAGSSGSLVIKKVES